MNGPRLRASVDRDSVCAGDDVEAHAAWFDTTADTPLAEFIAGALAACPLASISGGRATWIVEARGAGRIGVIAQQWPAPRLTLSGHTTVGALFDHGEAALHFRYWCQADPEAVLDAVRNGGDLPPRYG